MTRATQQGLTVGFIGLGMMGSGLATHAQRAGHAVRLLVRHEGDRERCQALIDQGALCGNTIADVASGADVVVLCVTGSPQVEEIVFGEQGLLGRGRLKAGAIVVDCSTSLPESSHRIAQAMAAIGCHFIDAAMTGTPKEAAEGRVNLLVGGETAVIDLARSVLESFSGNIYHCGPTGAGHTIKLLHQFVVLSNAAVLSEAFSCATKAGVDMHTLCQVIGSGGANSTAFQRLQAFVLEGRDELFRFTLGNALKDMDYYTRMTGNLRAVAPIAGTVLSSYTMANNLGDGSAFVPRLLHCIDQLNDVASRPS
ncbi:NAD(P)-dependent oxidoreductase [Herbaspirillum sp. NPDC087042]|uniref:NAD(P)-dependent oxidoreductase n=1 Tax=Herbaspirillum sp. NPDC087042 TaxID=3364004 RepID=UPI0038100CE1